MSEVTFTLTVAGADFATLAKVYALIADPKIKANVDSGTGAVASEPVHTEAPVKRKPGRPPGGGLKARVAIVASAPVPEAPVKRGPGRPRKVVTEAAAPSAVDLEEKFSKWHSSQKAENGRGKYFTSAEVKLLLPKWEAALKEYQRAAGDRLEGGRTTKNWSIARLRRETEAFGGSADQEGSPSAPTPSQTKSAKGKAKSKAKAKTKAKGKGKLKSRFGAAAKAQAAGNRRGRKAKSA